MHVHRGYTIIATASAFASGPGAYSPIYTVLAGASTGPVVHQDTVHADFPDEDQAREAAIASGIAWIDQACSEAIDSRHDTGGVRA